MSTSFQDVARFRPKVFGVRTVHGPLFASKRNFRVSPLQNPHNSRVGYGRDAGPGVRAPPGSERHLSFATREAGVSQNL